MSGREDQDRFRLGVVGSGLGSSSASSNSARPSSNPSRQARSSETGRERERVSSSSSAERRRRRRRGSTRRERVYGSTTSASRPTSLVENHQDQFFQHNRFSEFDPSSSLHRETDSLLHRLMSQHPSQERDHGDVWGIGDETDEDMQRLLEMSYAANTASSHSEDAMLEQAIQASMSSNTSHLQQGDEEAAMATAMEESLHLAYGQQDLEAMRKREEEEEQQAQLESVFAAYPEEVGGETIMELSSMHEEYTKSGGASEKPSVQVALERALKKKERREQLAVRQEALESELTVLESEGNIPKDVLQDAKQIYQDLAEKQLDSGGQAPTLEYALSLAQDKAKEKANQEAKKREEEMRQKRLEEEERLQARHAESRAERAARIAAAFEKKKQEQEKQNQS